MRRWWVGTATLMLVGAVAACGAGGASGTDRLTASGVAHQTVATGSARVEITTVGSGDTLGTPGEIASGEWDFQHSAGELRGRDGETRWIGSTFYSKYDIRALSENVPTPPQLDQYRNKWLKFDTAKMSGAGTPAFSGPLGPLGTPAQVIDFVAKYAKSRDVVGHETIRGVDTTHVHYVMDLHAVMKHFEQQGIPPDSTVKNATTDAWIDTQGRLRRLTLSEISGDGPEGLRIEFYDFGVPVHVEAPPPGETFDISTFDQAITSGTAAATATPPSTTTSR